MNKLLLSLVLAIFLIGFTSAASCGITNVSNIYTSSITGGVTTIIIANVTTFGSFGGVCAIENVALNYNNTQYSSYASTISGNNTYYNFSVPTPIVIQSTNISFNSSVLLSEAGFPSPTYTYYYSTNTNQTLTPIVIDDCSTGTFKLLNFTTYDEDTLIRLRNSTYNITYGIEVYLNDRLMYFGNKTRLDEFKICSNVTITGNLSLDYILSYDADGSATSYVLEYYNVQNFNLNSGTMGRNISLYDLISTSSEECLFTVKDSNFLPLTNGLIQIERKYLSTGDFKVVEIPKTDSLGKTIGHFVLNDEIYNVYIRKDNALVSAYENVRAIKPTGSDCVFNLNVESASSTPEDFTAYGNLLYESNYTDSNRTYQVGWVTNNGQSSNVTLYAYIGSNLVCTNEIIASSGTSQCVFGSNYANQTARLVLYNDGTAIFQDYINIGYKRPNLDPIRYIVAAALIPMLVLMAGSNIVIAVVFFIIGIILSGGLMLFDTESFIGSGSFISWLVVAGLILLFKFTRERSNG